MLIEFRSRHYVIALILKIHLSRSKTKIRVHYAPVTNGAQMAFTAFCDATLNCDQNNFSYRQFNFKGVDFKHFSDPSLQK